MSFVPIVLATCLYLFQVILSFRSHPAQALVLIGYIVANLGLIWSML